MALRSIRVLLPYHLRTLAGVDGEVTLESEATLGAVLEELERRYPMLRGTIREHGTRRRRPFVRYYACKEDVSHEGPDFPLPPDVVAGREPLLIIGALSGG